MIAILDYNMGNILSVYRKIVRLNVKCKVVNSAKEILSSDKLIIPGVGHFGKAMSYLDEAGLKDALNEFAFTKKAPLLGICLGMQIMAKSSEEGQCDGLGWFDCDVQKITVEDQLRYKVPHTGWNGVTFKHSSPLFEKITQGSEFYFVHSYCIKSASSDFVLANTIYESPFISSIHRNNLFGVQFHPEKSHADGEQLLQNFVSI